MSQQRSNRNRKQYKIDNRGIIYKKIIIESIVHEKKNDTNGNEVETKKIIERSLYIRLH